MKKIISSGIAVIITATSLSVFANLPKNQDVNNGISIASQGRGACTWTNCKCTKFKVGGASGAKCANCGHMDFNHK